MARIDATTAGGANRVALLDALALNEVGPLLLSNSDDGYNVLGNSTQVRPRFFNSPGAAYGGFPDCNDPIMPVVVAGRYRTSAPAWAAFQVTSGATTFDPLAQDRWALAQLAACGAIALIDAGQFMPALRAAAATWTRLATPSDARDAQMLAAYQRAGGQVPPSA